MKEAQLSRQLGLMDLVGMGVGGVVGSGIFILFGTILRLAGKSSFLALLLAAIPNILTAMAYAELSGMYQRNDVEFKSVEDAFSKNIATVTLYILLMFMVFNTVTVLLFIGHALDFLSVDAFTITLPVLFILSIINYVGIKTSKSITNIMAVIEITLLLVVSLVAVHAWKPSRIISFPKTNSKQASFWLASFLALFLFTGYDSVVKFSDETKDPANTVPRAMILTIVIVTILYLAIALSTTSIDSVNTASPVRGLYEALINKNTGWIVAVLGMFIVVNTAFIGVISMSRFVYGLSKDGELPSFLDDVNERFQTPHNAIIAVFVAFSIALLVYNPEKTAAISNIFFMVFMIVMMLNVIILRVRHPEKKRPFNITGMPILMVCGILLCCMYICIGTYKFNQI